MFQESVFPGRMREWRKMRKPDKIIRTLLMSLSLLSLVACGKDVQNAKVEKTEPVTIRTVSMFGGTDSNAVVYERIRDAFQNQYPYIKVDDESRVSDEEWKSAVTADFCAGNEPDVLQFFTDATANQLIAMDKFVSIEEIREVYPEYAKDTYEWALNQVANRDGVRRAVPTTGFWEGLYCNKDLFEKYGIPLPTDWDSFTHAIEAFESKGVVPVACSLTNVPHYWLEYFLLYSCGAEDYQKDFSAISQEWIDGLRQFHTLRGMSAFPHNTDTIDNDYARTLFINKKAAMILEGNWFLPAVEDQENTVVIAFPGLENSPVHENAVVGGMTSGFYITRRAWNDPDKRDAAVKYVMAQTSREAVQKYWVNGGGITTTATAVTDDMERTPLAESARRYVESADVIVLSTDSRMEPDAYKTLISGISEVSIGGDPRALLQKILE